MLSCTAQGAGPLRSRMLAPLICFFYAQVLKTGDKNATYADFLKELPDSDCRYAVFDVEYTDPKTGGMRNKITFFAWYGLPWPGCCCVCMFVLEEGRGGSAEKLGLHESARQLRVQDMKNNHFMVF
jgi:hypothetical protein